MLGAVISAALLSALVPRAVLVLTAWTLGSGLVALLAYRRRAAGSAN